MNKEKLKPKLFSVMKTYTKEQFLKDVVAGIIVAIIALPLSIALALASGVGPEEGIYTAIIAGFLISFLGGSRVQIAGPTAAFATIVAGDRRQKRNGWSCCRYPDRRRSADPNGCIRLGSLIPFYPIYHYNRIYGRYCCHDRDWAVKGLFRSDLCCRCKADRDSR